MPAQTQVRYCYKCGQRIKHNPMATCWYCGATTDRQLRPMRRCPYCDEEVGFHALKCPHCREFLDGRETPQPTHVTYVIDKAVIHAPQAVTLPGGRPVPPELRARLTQGTLEAIETDRPDAIDQAGVRALPAPDAAHGATVSPEVLPPVRAVDQAPAPAPESAPPPVIPEPAPKKKPRLNATEIEEDAHTPPEFRQCPYCKTECLGADNYCFHCGAVLRQEVVEALDKWQKRGKSNVWLLLPALGFLMGTLLLASKGGRMFELALETGALAAAGCSLVAALLIVVAFFRIRKTISQAFVLIVALLWLIATGYSAILFLNAAQSDSGNQTTEATPRG